MKKGFTLSELLMALTIVGVIAVLTVPVMMNNVQHRMFATQIKNMAATIEQLAQDQLIVHRTRDLSDTDFGDPDKLLTDKHFSITKTCPSASGTTDCWKTDASNNKVQYKLLKDNTNLTVASIKDASTRSGPSVILKNGVLMRYTLNNDSTETVGYFTIDINGNDKPNVQGRDLFGFYVSRGGHVVDKNITKSSADQKDLAYKIKYCQQGTSNTDESWCYGALVDSNWKMDY